MSGRDEATVCCLQYLGTHLLLQNPSKNCCWLCWSSIIPLSLSSHVRRQIFHISFHCPDFAVPTQPYRTSAAADVALRTSSPMVNHLYLTIKSPICTSSIPYNQLTCTTLPTNNDIPTTTHRHPRSRVRWPGTRYVPLPSFYQHL
jgi:hypothetical protein